GASQPIQREAGSEARAWACRTKSRSACRTVRAAPVRFAGWAPARAADANRSRETNTRRAMSILLAVDSGDGDGPVHGGEAHGERAGAELDPVAVVIPRAIGVAARPALAAEGRAARGRDEGPGAIAVRDPEGDRSVDGTGIEARTVPAAA